MSNKFASSLVGRKRALYRALCRRKPVPIDVLYAKIWPGRVEPDARRRHMRVGAVVYDLNRRLADRFQRVQPGAPRGTYQLTDFE